MSFLRPGKRVLGDDTGGGLLDWMTGGAATTEINKANSSLPEPVDPAKPKTTSALDKFFSAISAGAQAKAATAGAQYQLTAAAQAQQAKSHTTTMLIIGGIGLVGIYLIMKD